jgi:hypothetical protein
VGGREYATAGEKDWGTLARTMLGSATMNINTESSALRNYLAENPTMAATLKAYGTFASFTDGTLLAGDFGNAYQLLGGLRNALRDAKGFAAGNGYGNDMLQYATESFRGTNGRNGLSAALYLANLASDNTNRQNNASGYLINDVARTMTNNYLDINYDVGGGIKGDKIGSQYYYNYRVSDREYGSVITGNFRNNLGFMPTSGGLPALDCGGYVNAVLYAAGVLNRGQSLSQNDSHKQYAGQYNKYNDLRNDALEKAQAQLPAISGLKDYIAATFSYSSTSKFIDDAGLGGVQRMYLDDRITHQAEASIGSLVFMNGHIGIYGVNDNGMNILIHSAPQWPNKNPQYSSGPRENYLGSIFDSRGAFYNDSYTNMLVRNEYFANWIKQFSKGNKYNFARVNEW